MFTFNLITLLCVRHSTVEECFTEYLVMNRLPHKSLAFQGPRDCNISTYSVSIETVKNDNQ